MSSSSSTEVSSSPLTKEVIQLLVKSGFLELHEAIAMVHLNKQLSFGEHATLGCLATCHARPLGLRFSMWKRMLQTKEVLKDFYLIHRGDPEDYYRRNAGPNLDMDKSYVLCPYAKPLLP